MTYSDATWGESVHNSAKKWNAYEKYWSVGLSKTRITWRSDHQSDTPKRCDHRGLAPLERHQQTGYTALRLGNSSQAGCACAPQLKHRVSRDVSVSHNGRANHNRSLHLEPDRLSFRSWKFATTEQFHLDMDCHRFHEVHRVRTDFCRRHRIRAGLFLWTRRRNVASLHIT